MKILALIPIAGAFSLYGSAFCGLWTAPGLENFPTYDSFTKKSTPIAAAKVEEIEGVFLVSQDQDYQPEGVSFASEGSQPIALSAPDARMLEQSAQAAARKVPVQPRVQLPTPPPSPDPFAKHRIAPYRASTVGWRRRY